MNCSTYTWFWIITIIPPWAKCFWQNKHKQGLRWSVIYFYRCLFASQTATFQEHDMKSIFWMCVGKNAHNCKLPPRDLFVLCQEPPVERRDLTYANIHSSRLTRLLWTQEGCGKRCFKQNAGVLQSADWRMNLWLSAEVLSTLSSSLSHRDAVNRWATKLEEKTFHTPHLTEEMAVHLYSCCLFSRHYY